MKQIFVLAMCCCLLLTCGCQKSTQNSHTDSNLNNTQNNSDTPKQRILINEEITQEDIIAWRDVYQQQRGVFTQSFGEYQVILIGMGQKPTGGYSIKPIDIDEKNDSWIVTYKEISPQPGDIITQALTYPYLLIAVKTDKPIEVYQIETDTKIKTPPITVPKAKVSVSKSFIVEQPRQNSLVNSPLHIKGWASVFEGSFKVTVEDGHYVLAEKIVQALDGGPNWGEFELDLPLEQPTNPTGMIIFSYSDAESGKNIEELIITVKFE